MQFHWRRGVVEVDTQQTPRKATKKALDKHRHGAIKKEADILTKLNSAGITFVPQLQERGEWWFSYTRITWEAFDKVFDNQHEENKQQLITEFINKAYELDCLGIVHGELDRPMNNILVNTEKLSKKEPAIAFIDFERGSRQDFSGKNLRHVTQRLHRIGLVSLEQCKLYWTYNVEQLYQTLSMLTPQQKHITSNSISSIWHACLMILLLVGGDLLTKRIFYDLAWLSSTWLFTPVLNTGVWWSLPVPSRISISLAGVISIVLIRRMWKKKEFPRWTLLLIAGAGGNWYDRVVWWWVRDFIDFHYRPVFNIADIYLTLACCIILYTTFLVKKAW